MTSSNGTIPKFGNKLQEILDNEGLGYSDIMALCSPRAMVGAKTVSDLAHGKRMGSRRSWQRILTAINAKAGQTKYSLQDLLGPSYSEYLAQWNGQNGQTGQG